MVIHVLLLDYEAFQEVIEIVLNNNPEDERLRQIDRSI